MSKKDFGFGRSRIVTGQAQPSYNFDIEMDWSILLDNTGSLYPVTNQTTFEQWLTDGYDSIGNEQNDFTNIVITDFLMTGNRIQCNLSADGINFALSDNTIVVANKIGTINGLEKLQLSANQIVSFNPTVALPSTLKHLKLGGNQIVSFNPTIPLPVSLELLQLQYNQMTTVGYEISETWANAQTSFSSVCSVMLNNNISSASGTNFETILISKNCTVTT